MDFREEMSVIVVNLRGQVRHERVHGRDFLVAPATLIVPGVLNGSRGALYYPRGEVARNPGVWNHTPITVGHPTDPLTNLPVSGRLPDVLNRVGIGYVFNDRLGRDGQRQADLYFDIELTYNYDREHGTDILWRVENGIPLELSTGLFTVNEPARNGAVDDRGRAYDYVARDYRPDHLAVLPFEKGACSVADGCGVNVHNVQERDERGRFAAGGGDHGDDPHDVRTVMVDGKKFLVPGGGYDEPDPKTTRTVMVDGKKYHVPYREKTNNYSADQPRDERGRFAGEGNDGDAGTHAHFDDWGGVVSGQHTGDDSGMGQFRTDRMGQTFIPEQHALKDLQSLAEDASRRAATEPRWHEEAAYQYEGLSKAYRNMSEVAGGGEAKSKEAAAKAAYHMTQYHAGRTHNAEGKVAFCPDCGKRMLTENCPCGYTRNLEVSGTGAAGSPIRIGIGGGGGGEPSTDAEGPSPTSNDDDGGYGSDHVDDGGDVQSGDVKVTNTGGGTDDANPVHPVVRGGVTMPLTANQRKGIVDDLCVNCDCYKGQEKILNQLPDENLIRMKEQQIQTRNDAVLANTVRQGVRIRDTAGKLVTVNAGVRNGQLVFNAFGGQPTGGQKAEGSNATAKASNGPDIQAGGEEDAPGGHAGVHASVDQDAPVKGNPPEKIMNAESLMRDPWFKAAPPAVQQLLIDNARRDENYRRQLAERLVPAGVPQQVRNQLVANRLKLTTAELEQEVQVANSGHVPAGHIPLTVPPVTPLPSYAGAGVTTNGGYGGTDNRRVGEPDLLGLPKMEW